MKFNCKITMNARFFAFSSQLYMPWLHEVLPLNSKCNSSDVFKALDEDINRNRIPQKINTYNQL